MTASSPSLTAARAALARVGATAAESEAALAELARTGETVARLRAALPDDIHADDFPRLLRRGARTFGPGPAAPPSGVADPSAAVAEALERARAVEAELNPFIEIFGREATDRARRLGKAAREGKPLTGLPFVYKDAFAAPGRMPTVGVGGGYGWDGPPSTSLRRLGRAGAVAIAAANLDAHCYSVLGFNPFFGRALNPCDPRYAVGGSSSGSAVAVAAGVVPFALSTDTGGSARIPAALTGVYGLKPTHGRIADAGMAPLGRSQDAVGLIANTPALVAAAFSALAGKRSAPPRGDVARPLRVGIDRDNLAEGLDADVAPAFDGMAGRLSAAGCEIVDVRLPPLADLNLTASLITGHEAAALHGAALAAHPERYPVTIRQRLIVAAGIDAGTYATALRLRAKFLRDVLADVFSRVDVLLCPTIRIAAPRIDGIADTDVGAIGGLTLEFLRLNRPFNLLGLPSLSVPAGLDRNGIPIGMQLIGPPFADEAVMGLADSLRD